MLNTGWMLLHARLWIIGTVACSLAVSGAAAQDPIGAVKRAQLGTPSFSVGPTVSIDNGIPGDGRLEILSGRAGETSTIKIDPKDSPPLQNIVFELNHYVDVGADGHGVQLGSTTITMEPTLTGPNQVTSAGTFVGANDANTISWTAVATVAPGGSTYVTTMTFSSSRAFGSTRLIQYADIDVIPVQATNNLIVLGTFNRPDFQLVTVQNPTDGNIGLRQLQPQVTNAICVGWAAAPFFELGDAITGPGACFSPSGCITDLNPTPDPRFPGKPAFGPADITTAIACDLDPNATTATVVFRVAAEDVTDPDTSIASGPPDSIPISSASFTWTGSDNTTPTADLVYAFRLDPLEPSFSPFASATSKTYTGLGKGAYTLYVKARDQAGNEDLTPASRPFLVSGAMITSMAGSVEATFEGAPLPPGSFVAQGVKLKTGADGEVQGACDNGSRFTLDPDSSLFFEGSLCDPGDSGLLDLTQGAFRLAGVGTSASARAATAQNQIASIRTPVSVATMSSTGAEFSTTYSQVGSTGNMVIKVQSGTVAVTDTATGDVTVVTAGQQTTVVGAVPPVVAAILPSSRSVQVGTPATAFATILNAGATRAIVCEPSLTAGGPATLSFQTTDMSNHIVGRPSTPVSIAAGGLQTFLIALTPTVEILPPIDVQVSFTCGQTQVEGIPGVNTLLLSASNTPVPDIVALAATPGNTGYVDISGPDQAGVFAVATANVSTVGGTITASADTGIDDSLPVVILLCQTNPDSTCMTTPGTTVTTPVSPGATSTFGIFVFGAGVLVPDDPARNRVFVRFNEGGVTRGATSVAVRTK